MELKVHFKLKLTISGVIMGQLMVLVADAKMFILFTINVGVITIMPCVPLKQLMLFQIFQLVSILYIKGD